MSSSTLLEIFGHVLFSFTKSVTDHYNPEEPEFNNELFGYNPLESTGREWYYHPVDELVYQEYGGKDLITSTSYLAASSLDVKVIDACSTEVNETEANEIKVDNNSGTAWKRLRPSVCRTILQSLSIGALISLLAAIISGAEYILISYLCYETINVCEFEPQRTSIPLRVQWMRTIVIAMAYFFLYNWFFSNVLLLFRFYQLHGLKRKLFLAFSIPFCIDATYLLIVSHYRLWECRFRNFPWFKIFPKTLIFSQASVSKFISLRNIFASSQ